jgi:hypothetical protein
MKPAPGDLFGQAIFRPWRFSSVAMNWPGLQQAVVRAGVEPGIAAPMISPTACALLEIGLVDVRDLQFAARADGLTSAAMSTTWLS